MAHIEQVNFLILWAFGLLYLTTSINRWLCTRTHFCISKYVSDWWWSPISCWSGAANSASSQSIATGLRFGSGSSRRWTRRFRFAAPLKSENLYILYWHAAVDIISCSVLTGQINFILLSASPLFRDSIYSLKAIPCPAPAGTWDHFCVREKLFPQQLIYLLADFSFSSSSLLFICANCAREICLTLDTAVEQFITWFLSEFEFEFSCL